MYEKYPQIDAYRTGQNIKRIMLFQGYTVRDIQAYLSLSVPQTVYRWFEGRNLPSIDNLYALSGLFRVPLDELVAGDREKLPAVPDRRLTAYYRSFRLPLAG